MDTVYVGRKRPELYVSAKPQKYDPARMVGPEAMTNDQWVMSLIRRSLRIAHWTYPISHLD